MMPCTVLARHSVFRRSGTVCHPPSMRRLNNRTALIAVAFLGALGLVGGNARARTVCAERNGFTYLSLTVEGDKSDPRVDDVGGDLTPEWGLHLIDANVAMGDLVAIAQSQGHAYRSHRH